MNIQGRVEFSISETYLISDIEGTENLKTLPLQNPEMLAKIQLTSFKGKANYIRKKNSHGAKIMK